MQMLVDLLRRFYIRTTCSYHGHWWQIMSVSVATSSEHEAVTTAIEICGRGCGATRIRTYSDHTTPIQPDPNDD